MGAYRSPPKIFWVKKIPRKAQGNLHVVENLDNQKGNPTEKTGAIIHTRYSLSTPFMLRYTNKITLL